MPSGGSSAGRLDDRAGLWVWDDTIEWWPDIRQVTPEDVTDELIEAGARALANTPGEPTDIDRMDAQKVLEAVFSS